MAKSSAALLLAACFLDTTSTTLPAAAGTTRASTARSATALREIEPGRCGGGFEEEEPEEEEEKREGKPMPPAPTATSPPSSEEELEPLSSFRPPGRMMVQSRRAERCRASSPRFFLFLKMRRFCFEKEKKVSFFSPLLMFFLLFSLSLSRPYQNKTPPGNASCATTLSAPIEEISTKRGGEVPEEEGEDFLSAAANLSKTATRLATPSASTLRGASGSFSIATREGTPAAQTTALTPSASAGGRLAGWVRSPRTSVTRPGEEEASGKIARAFETSRTKQRTGTPSATRRETIRRPVRPVAPTTRTLRPEKRVEAAGRAPAIAGCPRPEGSRGEEVETTSPSEGVASSSKSSSTSEARAAAMATEEEGKGARRFRGATTRRVDGVGGIDGDDKNDGIAAGDL